MATHASNVSNYRLRSPRDNSMDGQITRKWASERATEVSESAGALPRPRIQVFVLSENRLLRDALLRRLRRRELEVVGCSAREATTSEDVTESGCDVLLMDFVDRQYRSLTKPDIQNVRRSIKIVAIGMSEGHEQFLEAVRCGVTGYLLSDASLEDVAAAIRAVASGRVTCPPQLCTILFQAVAQIEPDSHTQTLSRLTLRQQRVMRLVANGLTNKEIAEELRLSEFTVKNHMSRILKQLGAQSRSEAAEVVQACDWAYARH